MPVMPTGTLLTEAQRARVRDLIEHLLRVLVPSASQFSQLAQSPPYTVALPNHGQIVDALRSTWAVTQAGKISQDGTTDPVTGGVSRLIYQGGFVWQLSDYGWYSKEETNPGTAWAHSATGPVSAEDTQVHDPHEAIVDGHGYVAQLTHAGQIAIDGTTDAATKNVKLLQYHNKQLWQQITNGDWYHTTLPATTWAYSAAAPGAAPIQPPSSSSGHIALGIQAGDPWGQDGGPSSAIFKQFTDQLHEAPTEYCTFLEEHCDDWRDSAAYSASGIIKANSFPGSGKLIVASVGVPLVNKGSTWQHDFPAVARGDWDAKLVAALDEYANHNLEIMVRPGWEMNGNWYRWSVVPENASGFVDAFRRVAQVCHAYTRKPVRVCWNPGYIPGGSTDYTTFYPGDDAVDYVGIDTYGAASGVPNDSPFVEPRGHTLWCVQDAITFSLEHNKPLCFPETGCGPGDVAFPKNLAAKITSTKARINLMSLWNQPTGVGSGGQWSTNPECGEAWRQCLAAVRKTNAW